MSERSAIVSFDRETPLQELACGLSWVRWLLQSVRARCDHVHFHPATLRGPDVQKRWEQFGAIYFMPLIGPQITQAWNAAAARNLEALIALDVALDERLSGVAAERSCEAGAVLLQTTRGARYQGVLGHYRTEIAAGGSPGHFITVWAAVGNFFQLSLTNVLAEYLHLEWELGTREFSNVAAPEGDCSFSSLVSATLNGATVEPALVRREG